MVMGFTVGLNPVSRSKRRAATAAVGVQIEPRSRTGMQIDFAQRVRRIQIVLSRSTGFVGAGEGGEGGLQPAGFPAVQESRPHGRIPSRAGSGRGGLGRDMMEEWTKRG